MPRTPKGVRLGGRQKGTKNKLPSPFRAKTKKIVADALEGITPLEIMLDNMRFAHQAAEVRRLLETGAAPPDGFNELNQLLKFRDIAQTAAKDAARYVHAPIAAIDQKTGETAVTLEALILASLKKE
jgi:hypothetical protein